MSPSDNLTKENKSQVRFKSYLQATRELRKAIRNNIADYEFAYTQHGEIRYLFDTNIIRFFLNPAGEYQLLSFGLGLNKNVLTSLAIVTAEFLFSRKLCGQWGKPALISPAHAKEIENYTHNLIKKMGKQLADYNNQSLRNKITDAILKARQPEDLKSSIDVLFQSDHDIKRVISEETYEAQMFMRLAREDLLEPLFADILMTEDIVHPDPKVIDYWAKNIAAHRKQTPQYKNDKKKLTVSGADKVDGETVTQLILLNKAAKEVNSEARYVLITLDNAVYSAVSEWAMDNNRDVPVRRIDQYLPMLNLVEMPSNTDTSLNDDIGSAIDTLLSGLPDARAYGLKKAANKNKRSAAIWPSSSSEHLSDEANEFWTKLAEQSVYLNASLLSRRIDAFSDLAEFLNTSRGVRDAVVEYMQQTISNVEKVHAQFNIKNQLVTAIEGRNNNRDTATRGLLMLRPRFKKFTDGKPLYQFLNDIILDPTDNDLNNLYSALSDSSQYQTLLFAGCIAFWAGAWENAVFFADRAWENYRLKRVPGAGSPLDIAEIRYFQIVTRRYVALDSASDPKEKINELKRVLDFTGNIISTTNLQADDSLSILRLEIEKYMLTLTIAYVSAIVEGAHTENSRAHILLATKGFSNCSNLINQIEDDIDDQLLVTQVEAELYIGLSGCILYNFFFITDMPKKLKNSTEKIMNKVKSLLSDDSQIIPTIYSLAPDFLDLMLEPSQAKRKVLSEKLGTQLESAENQSVPATRLDQFVMHDLGDRLPHAMEAWSGGSTVSKKVAKS